MSITNECNYIEHTVFDDVKFWIVRFNKFPFICKILTYLKLEGGEIIVDNGPHLYLDCWIVNMPEFDLNGVISSTVETSI